MKHEEYLKMKEKIDRYVELNTKRYDLIALKKTVNDDGLVSVTGKTNRFKDIEKIDSELHKKVKDVINNEIDKMVIMCEIHMDDI